MPGKKMTLWVARPSDASLAYVGPVRKYVLDPRRYEVGPNDPTAACPEVIERLLGRKLPPDGKAIKVEVTMREVK